MIAFKQLWNSITNRRQNEAVEKTDPRPVLYVHAGYPKTGTTAIQRFLKVHREALKALGVLYPEIGIWGSGHPIFARAFLKQEYLLQGHSNIPPHADKNLAAVKQGMQREMAASPKTITTVIFSAEAFDGTDAAGLERLKDAYQEDFRIKPILYLRRQDKYAESLLAQAYQSRKFAYDKNVYLKEGYFKYRQDIELWESTFGPQNLILKEYPENAPGITLIQDFLNAVGIEGLEFDQQQPRANVRLDRLSMEYIRNHTTLEHGTLLHDKAKALLPVYGRAQPEANKYRYFYSPQERQQILDQYRDANEYISRKYFEGTLFASVPQPDLNEKWEPFPGLSAEHVKSMDEYLEGHGFALSEIRAE